MKIIALIAAFIHFYFFLLESILWTRPRTLKLFRMSQQQAETTQLLAFNQGFYNLFLAGAVVVGMVLGEEGKILVDYALISMALAGIILWFSKKEMRRGALIQALPPLIYFGLKIAFSHFLFL